ncbi:ABC transporter ATP-binding protein [Micromonospora rubida]|uniref:ABC transporter ATP-binding protein n=1 Tax=Micromonospora rubida TaxID=2697657 RepID=UPI00137692B5|nr:ABC transporter ATP-binding protein [Micromonospora rubida]NBE83482.1 ATP-binding cassette domain-containing protein [Micromonospora rubida]
MRPDDDTRRSVPPGIARDGAGAWRSRSAGWGAGTAGGLLTGVPLLGAAGLARGLGVDLTSVLAAVIAAAVVGAAATVAVVQRVPHRHPVRAALLVGAGLGAALLLVVDVAAPVPGLFALTALGLPWAVLVVAGRAVAAGTATLRYWHVGLLNGLGLAALLAGGTGGGSGYHWAAAGGLAALGALAGATAAELPGDAGWPPALRTLFDNATRPPTARVAVLAQVGLGLVVPGALIFAADMLRASFGLGPRGAVGVVGDALLAGAALAVLLHGERALRLAVAAAPAGLLVAAGALLVGAAPAALGVVLFASGLAAAVGALVALAVSGEGVAAEVLHPDARPAFAAAASVLHLAGGLGGAGVFALLGTRYGAGPALVVAAAAVLVGSGYARRLRRTAAADAERLARVLADEAEVARLRRGGVRPAALSSSGIDAAYGPVQVLYDAAVRVDDGEMVAICGPNGVGKTTLLRVLSGLHRPTAGVVRLGGVDVTALTAPRRIELGMSTVVGQAVFGSLTVTENLRMHGYALGRRSDAVHRGVDAAFAVFPRLYERRDQVAATLSGGERQLLVLAKTLIQRPRMLLVDELSLGLAPVVVGGLLEMLRRLNARGTSLLVVEQSVNVALSLADRIYFMEKGAMVAEHTAGELAGRPGLVRALMLGGHAPAEDAEPAPRAQDAEPAPHTAPADGAVIW